MSLGIPVLLFLYVLLFLLMKTQPSIRAFNSTKKSRVSRGGVVQRKTTLAAKNRKGAANAVSDFEKIKTAEVVLPVVFAHVLHYEPGELTGDSQIAKNGGDIYYTPEALQEEDFLESVLRSPFTIGTHEKNTTEHNRDIDGWPVEVWYDEEKEGVFVRGYVSGVDNVEYVEQNKDMDNFGTSAYIDFVSLVEGEGETENGESYSAQATKLHCNHIAILPNIRDEHNLIVALNSIKVEPKKEKKKPSSVASKIKNLTRGKNSMEKEELKEIVNDILSKREEAGAMDALNERLDGMDEAIKNMNPKNMDDKDDKPKGEGGKNMDDKDDKPKGEGGKNMDEDTEGTYNALPSQEVVSTVSNSLGVTFKETPTIAELAKLLDIKSGTFLEIISAINAKCDELKKSTEEAAVSGKNSDDESDFETQLRSL